MQEQYITSETILQDDFFGRKNPWRAKKVANDYLALAYDDYDPAKAQRLRDCCTQLVFRRYDSGERKLHTMNSCRVRLCPLCTWRRSLRTYADNKKMFDHIDPEGKKYGYILLTLTAKSCKAPELSRLIDKMMYAFGLMAKFPKFRKAVKGWYRGFEVTHNTDFLSASYDTYHPHFHVLLVVNKSYFTDRTYLSHDTWVSMWRQALQVDYDPVVDVRRIKNITGSKAVAEVSKYPVKDTDYIVYDDWDLTCDTVSVLDQALANRRLIAYGGILRDVRRQLKIDDSDDADLVHLDDTAGAGRDFVLEYYFWHTGYRQYVKGEE